VPLLLQFPSEEDQASWAASIHQIIQVAALGLVSALSSSKAVKAQVQNFQVEPFLPKELQPSWYVLEIDSRDRCS